MIDLYGVWNLGPEKALQWCEAMIGVFERSPHPDLVDKELLEGYRQKRDELREELGIKPPAAPAKQLDLMGV